MKGLKQKLADYLLNNAQPLSEIYGKFSKEKKATIRGRLNENIGKCFKRLGKGIYVSEQGDAKAIIVKGDAWAEIKNLADNSIDCIITDSPYTSLDAHYKIGSTRKRNLEKSVGFETKDIDATLLLEMYRVMKDGAHFFSFLPCDAKDTIDENNKFINLARHCGFNFNKRAIWDKQVIGMGYNMRNQHEQIIFLSKGKRRMPCNMCIPDVLSHKRIPAHQRIHVAQKPNELIEDLVKFATLEGEVVLDLFAGSLVLAEVCLGLNRHSISIESDEDMLKQSIEGRNLQNVVEVGFEEMVFPKVVRKGFPIEGTQVSLPLEPLIIDQAFEQAEETGNWEFKTGFLTKDQKSESVRLEIAHKLVSDLMDIIEHGLPDLYQGSDKIAECDDYLKLLDGEPQETFTEAEYKGL